MGHLILFALMSFHPDTSALARRIATADSIARLDHYDYWDMRERLLELRPDRVTTWWGWKDETDYTV